MTTKKYEFTEETKKCWGATLHRIKAIKNLRSGNVRKGDLGGFIEKEENLSHEGNAWVYGNACIWGNAKVYGDAFVSEGAWVFENAQVYGFARVENNAKIGGNAQVFDTAMVYDNAKVYGNAQIYGGAKIYDDAEVYDNAHVFDIANVINNVKVYGNAQIYGNAVYISGLACICGNACVIDNTDYITIGQIESYLGNATTFTFFKDANNGIFVSCSSLLGPIDFLKSLEEFRKEVEKVHGVNTKYAKVYQAAADLAEIQILCKEAGE